jgi:hypothetical protein
VVLLLYDRSLHPHLLGAQGPSSPRLALRLLSLALASLPGPAHHRCRVRPRRSHSSPSTARLALVSAPHSLCLGRCAVATAAPFPAPSRNRFHESLRMRPVPCGCLAAGVVRVAAGRAPFAAARGLSRGACRGVRCGTRTVHQALRGAFQLLGATQLPADVPLREIPVLRALSETLIQGQIMRTLVMVVVVLLAGCAHVPSPAELAAARAEEECREACLVKHRACLAGICSLGCPMSLFTCTARCSPIQRAALLRSN